MNDHCIDYILVGGGYASMFLALYLEQQEQKIIIFDDGQSKCSTASPAIFNPIVFKRLTLSWQADAIKTALSSLSSLLKEKFSVEAITDITIKKFLTSEEYSLWQKKLNDPDLLPYVKELNVSTIGSTTYRTGSIHAYRIHTDLLLPLLYQYFSEKKNYRQETFRYDLLKVSPTQVTYSGIIAKGIVFCEGHRVTHNPYFAHVKLKPVKGELLHIQCKDLDMPENEIWIKEKFLIPKGPHEYMLGSTYEWNFTDDQPQPQVQKHLTQYLSDFGVYSFKIISHRSGIRPASHDRRPIVGSHHHYENLYIHNGGGTKGSSIYAYTAPLLAHHIVHHTPVPESLLPHRFLFKAT